MRPHAIALVVLLFPGCGGPGRTPVVVYSPHGKEMLTAFERAYEETYPAEDVQWLDMGSQDALDRIRTEQQNPQADVWWGAPMTAFAHAEREGLLERYIPSWDSVAPAMHKSRQGRWYGTFITPEVIMYNSARVPAGEAPKDWDDLLSPAWSGKIIIRSPLASGTMRIIFSALIARHLKEGGGGLEAGLSWLKRLDANTKSYASDPTQLYLKIAREEGLVTVWDLPDVIIQTHTHGYPFGYIVPASGTPLITDAIAIVRGAKHPDGARRFYEYVTSRQSVLRQAHEFARIPARTDIPPEELPSWIASLRLRPLPVDFDTLAVHEKQWMALWDERVRGRGGELNAER
ncbi:MAG: extracellular solute-binding protein [Bacteroidota bacterium]